MQWLNLLPVLACSLMMLFCMKGMFGGHKHGKRDENTKTDAYHQDVQSLQIKMADLMEQNHRLSTELDVLKQSNLSKEAGNSRYNS